MSAARQAGQVNTGPQAVLPLYTARASHQPTFSTLCAAHRAPSWLPRPLSEGSVRVRERKGPPAQMLGPMHCAVLPDAGAPPAHSVQAAQLLQAGQLGPAGKPPRYLQLLAAENQQAGLDQSLLGPLLCLQAQLAAWAGQLQASQAPGGGSAAGCVAADAAAEAAALAAATVVGEVSLGACSLMACLLTPAPQVFDGRTGAICCHLLCLTLAPRPHGSCRARPRPSARAGRPPAAAAAAHSCAASVAPTAAPRGGGSSWWMLLCGWGVATRARALAPTSCRCGTCPVPLHACACACACIVGWVTHEHCAAQLMGPPLPRSLAIWPAGAAARIQHAQRAWRAAGRWRGPAAAAERPGGGAAGGTRRQVGVQGWRGCHLRVPPMAHGASSLLTPTCRGKRASCADSSAIPTLRVKSCQQRVNPASVFLPPLLQPV